jgi:alkyl sulfatase BDS1-like metallo-beta-lactamase superfamily hydrolase
MMTLLRHTATWTFLAIASCAVPAFAQNAAPNSAGGARPPAATAANGYGLNAQLPADRRAAHRSSEQGFLGAPNPYGINDAQGNTNDANAPRCSTRSA